MKNDYTRKREFWQNLESFVKDTETSCTIGEDKKQMILHNCRLKIEAREPDSERKLLIDFFMFFRDNGKKHLGKTIEDFVDLFFDSRTNQVK
jgi:hypothetical protein